MRHPIINSGPLADQDNLKEAFDKVNLDFTELFLRMFCVDDYGAVGDGTTDDAAAIKAAITAAGAGGTIYFTPGKTYLIKGFAGGATRQSNNYRVWCNPKESRCDIHYPDGQC